MGHSKKLYLVGHGIISQVRDVSGAVEKALTGFTVSAVLLRPDHYVAGLNSKGLP